MRKDHVGVKRPITAYDPALTDLVAESNTAPAAKAVRKRKNKPDLVIVQMNKCSTVADAVGLSASADKGFNINTDVQMR